MPPNPLGIANTPNRRVIGVNQAMRSMRSITVCLTAFRGAEGKAHDAAATSALARRPQPATTLGTTAREWMASVVAKWVTILNHEVADMHLPIQILQKKDWQAATIGHLLVAHHCCYS